MKKIILAAVAALALCGCLKETPKSNNTAEAYFHSSTQILTGLNGCYAPLRSIFNTRGFWQMTEVAADLLFMASATSYDANCDVSPARPSSGTIVWQNGYIGVMRANEMLADIDLAVANKYITKEEALPLKAEAVVLRSLFYYLLTCTFGDVPFYTEKVTEANRASIATLPRMSAVDTRDYCIEELMDYIIKQKALPMIRTYDNTGDSRIGAAVGLTVGAKMCLWNERWEDATIFISALESIYGDYSTTQSQFGVDYPLTEIPFSVKHAKESILEEENRVDSYGIQVSGLIASVATPTRKDIDSTEPSGEEEESTDKYIDNYDGILVPELGPYARTSLATKPTSYYYKQLLTYDSPDLRSGEYSNGVNEGRKSSGNLAWRWTGYNAKTDQERKDRKVMFFNSCSKATDRPWLGNKFWCYGMYDTKDFNNYKIFRFSDALLMKAEAYLNMDKCDDACKYLNITRTRAGLDPISYVGVGSDKVALMEEIRRERAKELLGEFQRKFDLVRWGIWYERTKAYNENKYLQDYIQPYHKYWPIPADQVSYSGGALDNNEYKQ